MKSLSLLRRCINGEKPAWDKFVEHFSQLIYWAIRKKLNRSGWAYTQQDIEDIFQNVFILLYEKGKLRQVKNKENISTWLVIVAANCTTNYFRNKSQKFIQKEPTLEEASFEHYEMAEPLEQERQDEILETAIKALSARERIILQLHYLHNRTHQEIGEILKMPMNTVSSILKRNREKIKEKLEKQGWKKF